MQEYGQVDRKGDSYIPSPFKIKFKKIAKGFGRCIKFTCILYLCVGLVLWCNCTQIDDFKGSTILSSYTLLFLYNTTTIEEEQLRYISHIVLKVSFII